MKIKIGTQMDPRVFRALKLAAARSNRAIGDLLEEAVAAYVARPAAAKSGGLRRFLHRSDERASNKVFKAILREDFYNQ